MTNRPKVLIFEQEHPQDLDLYVTALQAQVPGVEVAIAADQHSAVRRCAGVSILVGKAHAIAYELVRAMPELKWIQALSTGVDPLLAMPLPASVTLTSARGIHGPQMSELALLQMMALARDFPRMLRNQAQRHWERWPQRLLQGKIVVLVGVGTISEELAKRCQVLGMKVVGISSSRQAAPGFDEILPRSELARAAQRADFLIALVPYSAQTHHLIDTQVLAAMRPNAYFINIARGRVVDEAALIAALRAGAIAGAALDVFEPEPPAPDNPLWAMPNVIVTPHVGGMSDTYAEQVLPLLVHNLNAYVAGDYPALRNVVERP